MCVCARACVCVCVCVRACVRACVRVCVSVHSSNLLVAQQPTPLGHTHTHDGDVVDTAVDPGNGLSIVVAPELIWRFFRIMASFRRSPSTVVLGIKGCRVHTFEFYFQFQSEPSFFTTTK